MNINNCVFGGNVTRDVEIHEAATTTIAKFGIAVNGWGKDDKPLFLTVKCFGKKAEIAQQYVKKGGAVAVVGQLKIEEWDAKDGTKRTTVVLMANELILGAKPKEQGGAYAPHAEGSVPSPGNTSKPKFESASGGGGADDDLPFAPNVA